MLPVPTFSATESQYQRAIRRVESYITSTTHDDDGLPHAQALYSFHKPGHPVHGTVLLFHGLADTPELMRPTMTYLYRNNFNVYAPPGAGHAYNASRLPHTLLLPQLGADNARDIILGDSLLRDYFEYLKSLVALEPPDMTQYGDIVQHLTTLLERRLSTTEFDQVMRALQLISGTGYIPGFEAEIANYCESDHHRYESHPLERLCDVAALPGPVSVIGNSLGGLQAINLAARAGAIDKLVLIAPFLGFANYAAKPTPTVTLSALGTLDLYLLPFPTSTVSARHVTACTVAARLLYRDEISRPIRENTATFCVVSELDDVCSTELTIEFCRKKLANGRTAVFTYPKSTGLKHDIHPGSMNRFSGPLLQEIIRFLTTEKVQEHNMLNVDGDPSLPPVDPESLEINE